MVGVGDGGFVYRSDDVGWGWGRWGGFFGCEVVGGCGERLVCLVG